MKNLNFFAGVFAALAGFFDPISGVLSLMIIVILCDLVLGVWASRRRGDAISSRKLWRTGYKLGLSLLIVTLTFWIDKELQIIELHKLLAWLIVGFELVSMLESACTISEHKIFRIARKLITDKVKETTKINIDEQV